jgi:hypothetical protein
MWAFVSARLPEQVTIDDARHGGFVAFLRQHWPLWLPVVIGATVFMLWLLKQPDAIHFLD